MKVFQCLEDNYLSVVFSDENNFQEALNFALSPLSRNLLIGGHFSCDLSDGSHSINLLVVNSDSDNYPPEIEFDDWMTKIKAKYFVDA